MHSGTILSGLPARRLRETAAILPLAVLLTACDARTPTTSTPAFVPAPSGPRTEVSTPTMIGASAIFLPADNRASTGWSPSSITVSADSGKWIIVRVEGFVSDTYNNGECDPLREHAGTGGSTILCPPDPGHVTAWGPLSSGGSGGVDVALQRGPVAPIASGALPGALLAMYQPPDVDASVAEVLLNVHGTYNVWTHRRMNVSGGGTTFGGSNIEFGAFFLGGSQTVTVLEVPNPVKVSGPTAVTRGDSVTFTAQLTGNYTPRTAAGGQAGPFWYFHYNDTTAVANPATFYEPVDECHASMTCRIRADRQGRMYVTEFVETQQAQNHSDPMKLQQATLKVICPDSVPRGDSMTCTSAVSGPGRASEYEWTFTDSVGNEISGPRGVERWGGTMAVSGVIRLSAIIGGVRQTVVDTVHVRARTWPDKPLRLVERYVRCRRAIFNEESCPLLYPPRWISDLAEGRAEPTTDSLGEKRAVIVKSGPNQGWGYVAGATPPIPWDHYTIYYSDLLQTPTAAWWQEQHDPGCYTDAGVASLYAGVMHHERLHYQMLSDLFGGAHDVRANQQLEGLRSYGVSNDEWQQTYLSAINALGEDMMIRSGRNHDYPDVQTWQWDALCRPDLTSHPATNG